jgi:hypothetical protein
MKMLIGIIGDERDIHVYTLKKRIEDLRCRAEIINLPYSDIIFKKDTIYINKKELLSYDAFYIRQIPYLLSNVFFEETDEEKWRELYFKYVIDCRNNIERLTVYTAIIKIISEEKFVINPYNAQFYQLFKPLQFYILLKNKIPVPSYIVTNEESVVENVDKKVCKPLGSYREVNKKSKEEILEIIKERPVILQKYVRGKTVRASVLEDEVVGAFEIIHTEIDSRIGEIKYKKIELSIEEEETLLKCLRVLNMKYSEIDFIIDEEEKMHILDCNPSPGFMVLEEEAGLPISLRIAQYIIEKVKEWK